MESLLQSQNAKESINCSFSLPHYTHLDSIWMKQGLLRNWYKGFTFLFLESKVKFTPPYPPTLLPMAGEKGLWFSFRFMGLATFGASSTLLWTRPSSTGRSLLGEGVGKKDVICLGPYEVNESFLASGLQTSLSNGVQSCLFSKESKLIIDYWLVFHSISAACLDTVGFLEGWRLALFRPVSSMNT